MLRLTGVGRRLDVVGRPAAGALSGPVHDMARGADAHRMWEARRTLCPSAMPTRTERTDVAALLRTEHAVARVLASAPDEDDAHPRLLAAIGEALGWDFGALWTPIDADGSSLRCAHTWESDVDAPSPPSPRPAGR